MSLLTVNKYYKTNINDDEINKIKEEYAVDKTINMINTLNDEYEKLQNSYKCLENNFQRYKNQHSEERTQHFINQNQYLIKIIAEKIKDDMAFESFIEYINNICIKNRNIDIIGLYEDLNIEVIVNTHDHFSDYWNEFKNDFHETENNDDDDDYDAEYLNDYDNWSGEFQTYYIENEMAPIDYTWDIDGNLYYIE